MKYKKLPVIEIQNLSHFCLIQGLKKVELYDLLASRYGVSRTVIYFLLNPSARERKNKKQRDYWRHHPLKKHEHWSPKKAKQYYQKNQPYFRIGANVYATLARRPDRVIPLVFNGNKQLTLEEIATRITDICAHRTFRPSTITNAVNNYQLRHARDPPILNKQGRSYFLHPVYRSSKND